MNVSATKSIQFWVKPNGFMQFADVLEKSDLINCIMGTDNGAVVVEVDYDPTDEKEIKYISHLRNPELVLHHEYID